MLKFFSLIFLFSNTILSQGIQFTLKVEKCSIDTLFISDGQQEEFLLLKNNIFSKEIKLKPGFCSLNLGENYVDLFIIKNASLEGSVEFDNFSTTLHFNGRGANEANFMIDLQKISETSEVLDSFKLIRNTEELNQNLIKYRNKLMSLLPQTDDEEFLALANERIDMQVKYFEEVGSQHLSLLDLNGIIFPDFKFIDSKGNSYSFSNFKNKYLFVDIWATWCAPCIEDLIYLEKIKLKYKNDPVEFISISIDSKIDEWKKFISTKKLTGFQLISLNARNDVFFEKIKLITVPRYLLISSEGKILASNAPRPSSPELAKLLDSVVK